MGSSCLASLLVVALQVAGALGHGYLINPPSRSSAWRLGFPTPINYNDMELFCGGFGIQYGKNDGKCGVCGDRWDQPRPRDNEAGGLYGTGLITANYTMGQELTIEVQLTANHLGHFEFHLCVNNNPAKYIEDECLLKHPLPLADGSGYEYPITHDGSETVLVKVLLPNDLVCSQCVLRWHYRTGNSWGTCPDGTSAVGCGDQENFRGCADIAIV